MPEHDTVSKPQAAAGTRGGGGEPVSDKARRTKEDLKAEGAEMADDLRETVDAAAKERKHAAAERVHSVARALRQTGETLDADGERRIAGYGRQVADRIDRFGDYVDREDWTGLLHDAEDAAQRHPAAFLGSAFGAGLLLGRFLRASAPDSGGDGGGSRRAGGPGYVGGAS